VYRSHKELRACLGTRVTSLVVDVNSAKTAQSEFSVAASTALVSQEEEQKTDKENLQVMMSHKPIMITRNMAKILRSDRPQTVTS